MADSAQDFFAAMGDLIGAAEMDDKEKLELAGAVGFGTARALGIISDEWINNYFEDQMAQVRQFPSFAGQGEVVASRSFCPCKSNDRVVITGYSEHGMREAIERMDDNGIDKNNRIVPVSIMTIDVHDGNETKAVVDVSDIDAIIEALQEAKAASAASFAAVTGIE